MLAVPQFTVARAVPDDLPYLRLADRLLTLSHRLGWLVLLAALPTALVSETLALLLGMLGLALLLRRPTPAWRQLNGVLGAVEERLLVTDFQGRLSYVNRPAAALLGLAPRQLIGRNLADLIPALRDLLSNPGEPHVCASQLLQFALNGESRRFAASRSLLPNEHGYVWVLRDVTAEQRDLRLINETRQRYQGIFASTGVALCVFDLRELFELLRQEDVHDAERLSAWLDEDPERHHTLSRLLRLTEVNRIALDLLGVENEEQAWRCLVGNLPFQHSGNRFKFLAALLEGRAYLEVDAHLINGRGMERHLWMVASLPASGAPLDAIPLSIGDMTVRKRSELSLAERERYWAKMLRALPDAIYVLSASTQRMLFSNERLSQMLGYAETELMVGKRMDLRALVHPDDSDFYQRLRGLRQVLQPGRLLSAQLRARHRDGSWRWLEMRMQTLTQQEGLAEEVLCIAKDVTGQLEFSESLRDSERRYRLLAENMRDVVFILDDEMQPSYISPSVLQLTGYSATWLLRNGAHRVWAQPEQLTGLRERLSELRRQLANPLQRAALRHEHSQQRYLFDCLCQDGSAIPVELRTSLMWSAAGRFEGVLGICRDISQQRQTEQELRMATTVFANSTAGILVADRRGNIVQVNETFSRLSGYTAQEALGHHATFLTADREAAQQLADLLEQLDQAGRWEGELTLKRRSGEHFSAWLGIAAVPDADGALANYVCFFSDITERKASEQHIHRLAYYDALTLLPNRTLFQERLQQALRAAAKLDQWVVLIYLDLDRFKPINDSLGHAAGDLLLKDVALRLAACVQSADTVARMGGDEFTLLLSPLHNEAEARQRAIEVAQRILTSLSRPFVIHGREFFISASIGIALSPQDGSQPSQLMKNADTAMYHAKDQGKDNYQFYLATMNATALQRLELESDLRHAIDEGQFLLHYQPQLDARTQRMTGVEALLRWNHPRRGLVSPGEFIPVLEELGLVVQVGEWVLTEACRQIHAWQTQGLAVPKVSVNLSARQFADGMLGTRIADILASSGLQPSSLELELTESILMQDVGAAMQVLTVLKQMGLSIAVDDFGTGYSSLNYLKQFPINVLKIDRSFVDGLPDGEQDAQIARAIIAMAHSLNLSVIAEGVESLEQLDFLRDHGCDEIQGFLLSRPLSARVLEERLRSGSGLRLEKATEPA